MSETQWVQHLMARVKAGDQQAAAEVYGHFAGRLLGLARKRLQGALQRKLDPEDIVQSVFKTFFRRHQFDEIEVQNIESLAGLLAIIVLRKCGEKVDYFLALRRSVNREQEPRASDEDASQFWEAMSGDPTPEQVALMHELVEQIRSGLDERDQQIFSLTLEGWTTGEISQKIGCSERTARRVLNRLGRQLEQPASGSRAPAGDGTSSRADDVPMS